MAEGSIDQPSTSGSLPAEGSPSNPVALVRWQAEVNSVLPPAQEIEALERTIPQAGERLLRLVEREAEHRQVLEKQIVAADNFRDWRHHGYWCDSSLDWCCISRQENILSHAFRWAQLPQTA